MPHIAVQLYPGRSAEAQMEMAEKLRACLAEAAGWKLSDISVSFEGIAPDQFSDEVHKKFQPENLLLASDYIK